MTEPTPTYQQVIDDRKITHDDLQREFSKLKHYKPDSTKRCFAGNPILYHYQLDNLCRVKVGKHCFYDVMNDDALREEWWIKINKYACGSRPLKPATRLFEIYRRCTGAVVFFKPTVALNVYHHFKPTHVLDPCAGWGGRMLGAMAYGCGYTGMDTNISLRTAYTEMIAEFPVQTPVEMIWGSSLEQDFSQIDYDCVLTSPPYFNLEVYEHMNTWKTEKEFYETFLIPLITKCRESIRRGGKVCFNISPKMYETLLGFGYEACMESMPMLQQKVRGKDKMDMIYIWSGFPV